MQTIISQMLLRYNAKTIYDQKNALKEVVQEIVLCGLSRFSNITKNLQEQ